MAEDFELPYNPEDPPYTPPAGADPLVWRLARGLWLDHQPHAVDIYHCVTCKAYYPCVNRQLADRGLMLSVTPAVFHRLRPEVLPYAIGNSSNERWPVNENGPHPTPGQGRSDYGW
jgi:hypothetical protein